MKVLALYDVHGNIDALEAVLDDPRAHGADAVVVGGDVVPGPFARAVLDRLRAIPGPVHWIRGNGEREVAEAVHGSEPDPSDTASVTSALSANELGAFDALQLGDLPLTAEVDGVLYCHATPRCDDEMVTRWSTDERWDSVLAAVSQRLVVGGHTHQQDDRTVGDVRFVNAGSVGLPYEGDGSARWLWVSDGEPELRSTTYDAKVAGERILEEGWPDRDSVVAALVELEPPDAITELFEQIAVAQSG